MRSPRATPSLPAPRPPDHAEVRIEALVDSTDVGIVSCDPAGRIVLVNATARAWGLGTDAEPGDGCVLDADGRPLAPEQLPWRAWPATGRGPQEVVLARQGRPYVRVLCYGQVLQGDDGRPTGSVVALHDISALHDGQASVHRSAAFHDAVLAASPDLIFVFDPVTGRVTWSAPGPLDLPGHAGVQPTDLTVDVPAEHAGVPVHPDDVVRLRAADVAAAGLDDGQVLQVRYRVRNGGGEHRWLSRRVTPFARNADGSVASLLAIARDVTDVVQMEQRLSNAALHDPLTGLPNRTLLTDRVGLALSRTARTGEEVVVLFCDLDGFKHINDTAGHAAGDAVLVATARRLREVLRPQDTVARVGGDEFVVVLEPQRPAPPAQDGPGEPGPDLGAGVVAAPVDVRADAVAVARRISDAVRQPVEVDGVGHVVTVSIGVTFASSGDVPEDVLRDADSAMYLAKSRGKDRHEVFQVSLREDAVERGRVEHALRSGLGGRLRGQRQGEPAAAFAVAYQPILDLDTGRLVGVEALARLQDADGRPIPPDAFIPVAEDTGLIGPLGRYVLETACSDLAAWHAQHPASRHVGVAVNVSARQAGLPDLVGVVESALRRTGLAARCLTLELTESVLLEAGHVTTAALRALRELGVQVSIDDFGTGYASLRYLTQLPVTGVKVDRSFTSGLPGDAAKATIVRVVTTLATELGLTCVVEGIETEEQLHALPGGVLGQGYLLGRPMSAQQLGRRLSVADRPRPARPRPAALVGTGAAGLPPAVLDPDRLRAVRATGLLDSAAGHSWDELATLAARLLEAPMAFLTIVDDTRSYWLSCVGVDGLGPGDNQNPVSHSFCQYVIADRAPFLVGDAAAHPRTRDNPSVSLLGVRAWAGYPVLDAQGRPLGSFCVMDTVPRTWSERDAEVLAVLAASASAQVQLLSAVHAERQAEGRLQRLTGVALQLAAAETVEDLAGIVIERGLPVLGADGGLVVVFEADGTVRPVAAPDDTAGALAADPLHPACVTARTGRRLQLPDRAAGLAFAPGMAGVHEVTGCAAWACSPLRTAAGVTGALAVSWVQERSFEPEELELVDAFAAQCAQALERIRAQEAQRGVAERVRRLAESLQQALLTPPPVAEDLELAVRYQPASDQAQVGGDWYDAFQQPDGSTVLVVGDVVGHDADAAAEMGQLRGLLRALAYPDADRPPGTPAQVLTRVERVAKGLAVDTLATVVLARVGPRVEQGGIGARTVQWSSAGHLPPVLVLPGGAVSVLSTEPDLLLGVLPDTARTDHTVALPDGATLLLFTDGLVERRGRGLDRGLDLLQQALLGLHEGSLEELCDGLLTRLAPGAGEDDIALLALRVGGAPGAPREPLPQLAELPVSSDPAGSWSPVAWSSGAPDGARARLTLSPDPAAVGVARRFVDDACRAACTAGDLRDSAVLLTSELVTNSFLHGRSRTRITLTAGADRVRVEVADECARLPRAVQQDLEALGGRGMALVEALAAEWGVQAQAQGKCVWFEVRAPEQR